MRHRIWVGVLQIHLVFNVHLSVHECVVRLNVVVQMFNVAISVLRRRSGDKCEVFMSF